MELVRRRVRDRRCHLLCVPPLGAPRPLVLGEPRSEEHTSELQSLMRISYDVFCLKKKTNSHYHTSICNYHEVKIVHDYYITLTSNNHLSHITYINIKIDTYK